MFKKKVTLPNGRTLPISRRSHEERNNYNAPLLGRCILADLGLIVYTVMITLIATGLEIGVISVASGLIIILTTVVYCFMREPKVAYYKP